MRGTLSVSKSGRPLLWNGCVLLIDREGEVVIPELSMRADSVQSGDASGSVRGSLALPGGGSAPVSLSVEKAEDRLSIGVKVEGDLDSYIRIDIAIDGLDRTIRVERR